jgi:choline monooxygenase
MRLSKEKCEEMLERVMLDFDPTTPLSKAHTLPSYWYFDEDFHQIERMGFLSTWQPIGRLDQVKNPGDFFTFNLVGEPMVAQRNEENEIRILSNVCRHRGAEVMTGCGNAKKMRCPYHGWTYDLSGNLKGVPEFEGVEDFCREKMGLPVIPYKNLGPILLAGFYQPDKPYDVISEELVQSPLWEKAKDYVFYKQLAYDIKCNWKVFVDNYLDGGYHVNYIHPSLSNVLNYKEYYTTLHEWSNLQSAPLKKDGVIDAVRSGAEAQYWWLYPNLMINMYEGTMDTNIVFPTGKDTCRVLIDFYFAPEVPYQQQVQSMRVCDDIQKEDVGICESVQRGLNSDRYSTGRFSVRREGGGLQFHQLWSGEIFNLLDWMRTV